MRTETERENRDCDRVYNERAAFAESRDEVALNAIFINNVE